MSEETTKPAAKPAKKPAKRKVKSVRKAPARKAKLSKAGPKKSSFVIWVDKKQAAHIKSKAKKAGLTQADYFRKALKLPTTR